MLCFKKHFKITCCYECSIRVIYYADCSIREYCLNTAIVYYSGCMSSVATPIGQVTRNARDQLTNSFNCLSLIGDKPRYVYL